MALTDKLSAIGNAIRAKTGKGEKLTLDQMPGEIAGISGGGTLGAISVTENGVYNEFYETASVTWNESAEYDGILSVDGLSLRYKKVAGMTVPDDVSALKNSEYRFTVTYPDGTERTFPLRDLRLGSADGVHLANDLMYAVVWIKDATFVNAGYGASLEDNTVYVTDFMWVYYTEFAGCAFTLTAPGKKLDGISSVAVNVQTEPTTDPVLQEKFVTENGEVLPDDGYDGLSKVTVDVQGGLAINGIIKQYKVNAGATVNAGDFVEFVNKCGSGSFYSYSIGTYYPGALSACKLDNNRVLIAYAVSESEYGYAVILTINEGAIAVGKAVLFASGAEGGLSIVALSQSKAVVTFISPSNYCYGKIVVLNIEGNNITAGAATTFEQAHCRCVSAVALSESRVFIAAGTNSNTCIGYVCTVADNSVSITCSNTIEKYSGVSTFVAAVGLSENRVVVTYTYLSSGSYYGRMRALLVTDTSISMGSILNVSYNSNPQITALSNNKILLVYVASGSVGQAQSYAIDTEGTTITKNGSYTFATSVSYPPSVVALSEEKALVAYVDNGNNYYGTAIVLTVGDTTVEGGEKIVYYPAATTISNIVAFSESSVLVVHSSTAGMYTGLTIDGTTITVDGVGQYVQPATGRLHNVGIAATGGAEGETVDVYMSGIPRSEIVYDYCCTFSAKETTAGTALTSSVNCAVGDLVVAAIATRDTLTLSDGWTLISTSDVNSTDTNSQRLSWAYKFAESTMESLTVTQASEQRLYINMVALPGASGVTDSGYSYRDDTTSGSMTVNKPDGLVLWGLTTPLWGTTTPYPVWTASNDAYIVQLGTATQSRLGVALDQSEDESVTFTSASTATTMIVGCLRVHGMDKFYTASTHTWLE